MANGVQLVGRSFKYHRPRGILTAGLRGAERAGRAAHRRAARAEHARHHRRALRRADRREPEPLAVARLRHRRRQRPAVAVPRRGLLLQDLHVAGRVLGDAVRAADPPRRRARPRRRRRGSRPLREGVRALRRAGDRRRADRPDGGARGRPRRRARDPGGRGLPARRAAARRALRGRRQAGRRMGRARSRPSSPRCPRCGSCAAPRSSACSITAQYGAVERVNDHLAVPPPHQPRQRAWKIVAKRAVLAAGALERPIAFGNNDRPGVMLAGAMRSYINRYAAAPGRRLAVFTNNDDGWRTAADAHAAGIEVAAVIDSRAEPAGAVLARSASRCSPARACRMSMAGADVQAIDVIDADGRTDEDRMRRARACRAAGIRRCI